MPGRPTEQLLEVISFRRADGREVSLREFSIAEQLGAGETLRTEEIVLSVPDGRSVRTLINSAPVHGEGGAVASVVVTVQDLAPLDEIERLRTEFLGLVSHELREPLAAIKGSATTLLEDAAALDPAEMREFHRIIVAQADHMRGLIGDLLDAGRIDSGTLSVAPEPSELAELVEQAREHLRRRSGGRHGIVVDLPVGPASRDGRPPAHRAGARTTSSPTPRSHAPESSPIRVAAVLKGGRGRGLGRRRRPWGGAGAACARLFDKHAGAGRGRRIGGPRPGACHLQGAGGGAWRPHPGGERRRRARHHGRLHPSGGGGARPRDPRPPGAGGWGERRGDARPGGRRRSEDAALRARRAVAGRLRPAGDRRGAGARTRHPRRAAAARAARPDAARPRTASR